MAEAGADRGSAPAGPASVAEAGPREGWLEKQGKSGAWWRRRWCVLQPGGGRLDYYAAPAEGLLGRLAGAAPWGPPEASCSAAVVLAGSVPLRGARVERRPGPGGRVGGFSVLTPGRAYRFRGAPEDAAAWAAAVEAAAAAANGEGGREGGAGPEAAAALPGEVHREVHLFKYRGRWRRVAAEDRASCLAFVAALEEAAEVEGLLDDLAASFDAAYLEALFEDADLGKLEADPTGEVRLGHLGKLRKVVNDVAETVAVALQDCASLQDYLAGGRAARGERLARVARTLVLDRLFDPLFAALRRLDEPNNAALNRKRAAAAARAGAADLAAPVRPLYARLDPLLARMCAGRHPEEKAECLRAMARGVVGHLEAEAGGAAVVTDDLLEYLVLALLRSDSECLVTHSSFIDEFLDLARPENGELAYHATNFTVACFFLMDAPVEDVRAMYDKHRQADSVSPLSKRPRQSISEFVQVESPSRRKSSYRRSLVASLEGDRRLTEALDRVLPG